MTEEDRPQVVVERDDHGVPVRLICPECGKDDIREHDACERWNPLHIEGRTIGVHQLDANFETVGLICADCATELDAPKDVFERMTWS